MWNEKEINQLAVAGCWANNVTLIFDHRHGFKHGFSRSNFEIVSQEWEGLLTLNKTDVSWLFIIMTVTFWWPRSGVRICWLVNGVTSDVGMPLTHLVLQGQYCNHMLNQFGVIYCIIMAYIVFFLQWSVPRVLLVRIRQEPVIHTSQFRLARPRNAQRLFSRISIQTGTNDSSCKLSPGAFVFIMTSVFQKWLWKLWLSK